MKRITLPFASVLLMLFAATGCTTAIERWEVGMTSYTAANNIAADLYETGKIDQQTLAAYREIGKVARAALDAWAMTISLDGKTDDGAARTAAESALNAVRNWLATRTRKQ